MTAATLPNPTIPPGYKQTEVGVLPEDWASTRIDAHAVIKTGGKNTQDRIEDGAYPFFVRSQDVERIDSYSYDGEAVLTAGDGVGTGKVFHYVNGRFDVHQRVYRISDFSEQLSGRYFFFQFSTRFYDRIMSMTAKSSVDSVRMEMIAGMQLPLPPTLAEQEAIAGALSDADEWIESLEKLIEKKRAIKQGTMQALLTPPGQPGHQRLPGFTGGWEVKRLGEIVAFENGDRGNNYPSKSSFASDGFPFVNAGHLQHGYICCHDMDYITNEAYNRLGGGKFHDGDILFCLRGSIGKFGLAGKPVAEGAIASSLIIIRARSSHLVRDYLLFYLGSKACSDMIERWAGGAAQPNLGGQDLAQFEIPIPPLPEQTAIAAVLSDMDAEIEALEAKLVKARHVKQGMMQELLTGRLRLV